MSDDYSYARYRDSDHKPLDGLFYKDSSNTTFESENKLIPEFQDIAYPVLATFVIFAVVRRRSRPVKGRPDPSAQACVAPTWPTD